MERGQSDNVEEVVNVEGKVWATVDDNVGEVVNVEGKVWATVNSGQLNAVEAGGRSYRRAHWAGTE